MRRHSLALVAGAALAVGFVAGVYLLFSLRFEIGSAWPLFSTYRPDPLGAKALYESIALQPGLTVQRNTRPLMSLHGRGTTLFLLGLAPQKSAAEEQFGEMERMATEGARVVVAFLPAWPAPPSAHTGNLRAPFEKELGVELRWETEQAESGTAFHELPRHTALWFANPKAEWSVVRRWHEHPVLIERAWKSGAVVLVADSWMLSNDALAHQPDAAALAWLAGPNRTIIFDEHHLGIEDSGSVAGLMRRYRLQTVIATLLVLAGLFIWKNASSFPPRAAVSPDEGPGLRGYSASEGLVCLLERSVPARELARVCAEEYRSTKRDGEGLQEALRAAARDADPVRAYDGMRRAIEETRHPWKQSSNG